MAKTAVATAETTTLGTQPAIPVAEAVEEAWFDEYGPQEYPLGLYDPAGVAEGIEGFGALTDEHVAFFRDQGYLVAHNAFSPAETQAALEGLLDLIDGKNPAFKGIQFEVTARDILPTLQREQKQDYVRKLNAYVDYEPRLKAVAEHPQLLAIVTRLIGEAPALFANQAMLKPPLIGREKPWHQDHAFFNLPMGTPIVGVWVALDEALPENGCMHVIPGGHREPIVHFKRRDWQICDDQVPTHRVIAVPLKPGGVLFFDGLMPHGTPATQSPRRRRALQLHYVPASVAKTSTEERMAIFGGEAKGLTC
jgi:phytanoyl-CoA hydroxylase